MRRNGEFLWSFLLATLLAIGPTAAWTTQEQCEACKDMHKNFQLGLTKSRRSNFGGGNTAWEESRLGAWIFSETRLVGILETVCKDASKPTVCNALVEENEEAIEEWWQKKFRADTKNADLFQFLCIQRLKVCCSELHFGAKCLPCPGILKKLSADGKEEEKACFDHGECEGAGLRSGTGECTCNSGYEGERCSQCSENFFNSRKGSKKLGDVICEPCHDACVSDCSGPESRHCSNCKDGWQRPENGTGCEDVDECKNTTSPVCTEDGKYCNNTPGSYDCLSCHEVCARCRGPSEDNCTACAAGYRFTSEPPVQNGVGRCEDVNECLQEGICPPTKVCRNMIGSHLCECPEMMEENENGLCVPKPPEEPDDFLKEDLDKEAETRLEGNDSATGSGGKKHDEL